MTFNATVYVTTPIYYVNGSPHFAHAYTTTACDMIARFNRLDGRPVRFVTGTDEHGQKIARAARDRGISPAAFCDGISAEFQAMNRLMNISNDDFVRTTEKRHLRACQAFWRTLDAAGQIYLGRFGGWYSVRDEAYYDEEELIGGLAPTGAPVEWVEEENYFFRLSEWAPRLLEFYEANPDFIGPASRRNEVVSFVRGGLRDLSISRTGFDWGIPVPGAAGHVMYVWLDALVNYLTAAGYPDAAPTWPADLHLVGKDIIRFHCVYWPAFLMAAGLAPPRRVFAHGWWTVEGQKMSKSLNNFTPPGPLVERHGLDAVRYFMIREFPFGADGDLNEAGLERRVRGELANEFGNLAFRILSMVARFQGGVIHAPDALLLQDRKLIAAPADALPDQRAHMAIQELQAVVTRTWEIVAAANRHVQESAPWAAMKTDPARANVILYSQCETLRGLGILLQPLIPDASRRLLDMLGVPEAKRSFADLQDSGVPLEVTLPPPEILFPQREAAERPV